MLASISISISISISNHKTWARNDQRSHQKRKYTGQLGVEQGLGVWDVGVGGVMCQDGLHTIRPIASKAANNVGHHAVAIRHGLERIPSTKETRRSVLEL